MCHEDIFVNFPTIIYQNLILISNSIAYELHLDNFKGDFLNI